MRRPDSIDVLVVMPPSERRLRRSFAVRSRWKRSEYREKVVATSKRVNGDRMRLVVGPASKTIEARRKTSETLKRMWADPKFKAARTAAIWTKERLKKHGTMMKKLWTPERRARHSILVKQYLARRYS